MGATALLGRLCFIAIFAASFFTSAVSTDTVAICLAFLGAALIVEAAIEQAAAKVSE